MSEPSQVLKPQNSTREKPAISQALRRLVREHGRGVLANLTISLRTAKLYSLPHVNVSTALEDLLSDLAHFFDVEGRCTITRLDDSLLVNDVRLRIDVGGAQSYQFVLELMRSFGIGEISFSPEVREVDLESLVSLFARLRPEKELPWASFSARLADKPVPNVTFRDRAQRDVANTSRDDRTRARTMGTFFKAIQVVKSTDLSNRTSRPVELRTLTRAVQSMVDLVVHDDSLILSLVNIKDPQSQGSNHAVNVSVLALAMGNQLGLGKKVLRDLGFAALLHDVGKLVAKSDEDESTRDYEMHVFRGVERLLGDNISETLVRAIRVSLLHHLRHDQTGFPRFLNPQRQDLFSRIVAIADFYDNESSPGRSNEAGLPPDQVMARLIEESGTRFDPVLVKVFVQMMGLYPVGSMVRLDTGEVATVVSPPQDPNHIDRPRVHVVLDAGGERTEREINLLERDPVGGFVRSIIKIYQQTEVGLEVGEYLSIL